MKPAVIYGNGHGPCRLMRNGILHTKTTRVGRSGDSPMDERPPLEPAESWYLVNAAARTLDGFWYQFLIRR